ncbi:MAG TPA: ACP phosphodiesterase [Thermoanaerobaculia bacterium]|nr:ACP phosphodiesterase [Thermoanaerobaculia bacterium]
MNHLAHLFLAGEDDDSLIGNIAGDFVKGPLADRYTVEIRKGIQEHRRIDGFTDAHPSVGAFRRVLVPEHGHYARVIADVFFDHFLASRFEEYAGESLDAFLLRTFARLDANLHRLPGALGVVYPLMRDQRWLQSYATIDGIHRALSGISRRLSRRPQLQLATRHLVDSRDELELHFRAFFPDVVAFANAIRSGA